MNYRIKHETEYTYQQPATLCHNIICQGPSNNPYQKVTEFICNISPEPSLRETRIDFFDNSLTYFSIEHAHMHLMVKVLSEVRLEVPPWISLRANETTPWEEVRAYLHTTKATNDSRQFYLASPHVSFHPQITDYALLSFTPGRPIMDATMELCSRIYEDFTFTPGFTEISTPVDTVFEHRKGVCQDFAHFALSCLRSMGLAARYISGYIETIPPPGKKKLVGSDASHAWIAVLVPELGWVEYDATNNLLVNDQHIRAAYGRDFSDVVPLKGIVYSGGEQEMKVSVDVAKVQDSSAGR